MELITLGLIAVRLWVASLWFVAGGVLGFCYGLVELLSCATALCVLLDGRIYWDRRAVSLFVPFSYYVGSVVVPVSDSLVWSDVAGLGLLVIAIALLVNLGPCYTVGPIGWVRLVDWGFYAWVRHPMAALRLVMRWLVVAANLSTFNVLSAAWWTAIVILAVVVEEDFLRQRHSWREYAERVRWRLCPGLW